MPLAKPTVQKVVQHNLSLPFVPRPWQHEIVQTFDLHRYLLLNIHRGGGKTYLLCWRLIMSALKAVTRVKPGHVETYLYIAMSLQHAKKNVWDNIFKVWLAEHEKAGTVSFNSNDLSISFHDIRTRQVYARILMFGVDSPEAIRGQHVHGVGIDEAQGCPLEVFNKIIVPTIGQNGGWMMVIGTPNGPDENFLFYSAYKQANEAESGSKFHAVTKTVVDTGEYPEDWEFVQSSLMAHEVQQEYYCSFNAAVEGRIYHAFDEEIHLKPLSRRENHPLFIGIDFNVSFMPAIVCQKTNAGLEVIAEHIMRNKGTQDMAEFLKDRYGTHNVFICPDASGANRTTKTINTDHTLLQQAGFKLLTPAKNPLVTHRLKNVNLMFKNSKDEARLWVDPEKCPELLNTLRFHVYTGLNETPDKKHGLDHCGDALGYAVWQSFPVMLNRKSKRLGISLAA